MTDWIQPGVDELARTSRQRVLMVVVAVVAAVAAAGVVALAAGSRNMWAVGLVGALAIVASLYPATHVGVVVIAVVVWQWWMGVDDVTSPWSVALAGLLLVFHALVALMAVVPHRAPVPGPVVGRWLIRAAAAAAAAVPVWAGANLAEEMSIPGTVALTGVGLGLIALGARWLRSGTLGHVDGRAKS